MLQTRCIMATRPLTSSLHVRESTRSARLATDIEQHRSARLVISRIEKVPLIEGSCFVRYVPIAVWEVVDLY